MMAWAVALSLHAGAAEPGKAASPIIAARDAAVLQQLPFADRADFEAARRGLVAPFEGQVRNDAGDVLRLRGRAPGLRQGTGPRMTLNWSFDDAGQSFALTLRNGVVTQRQNTPHARPDATVHMAKVTLDRISLRQTGFATAWKNGDIRIEGNAAKAPELFGMLSTFQPVFPIVTP